MLNEEEKVEILGRNPHENLAILFGELSHDSSVRECPGGSFGPSHESRGRTFRLCPETVDPRTRLASVSRASKKKKPAYPWDLFLVLPLRDPGPEYTGPILATRQKTRSLARVSAFFLFPCFLFFSFPLAAHLRQVPPRTRVGNSRAYGAACRETIWTF